MKPIEALQASQVKYVFTDIDGTLTEAGRLPESSYSALWMLHHQGFQVIPVTGRPAGWCDLIARQWPVHGVIGENGGLVYRFDGKKMRRHEFVSTEVRRKNRAGLRKIAQKVLKEFPKSKIAADQFCRRFDLAIDFAEDVQPPLSQQCVLEIKKIFEEFGAHAKISNIHVNGWFGNYDKLSACHWYCENLLSFKLKEHRNEVVFVGDSPNDEPMFAYFPLSCAVANVRDYLNLMKHHPKFISKKPEGDGFLEIARHLCK